MESNDKSLILDEARKWMQNNALMYRGDNASDCMISAFCAGVEFALDKKMTETK